MSQGEYLLIDKKERARLWKIFLYEKMLDDNEQRLLDDLQYYEERIRDIGSAISPVEVSLLKHYMEHIKNTRTLLFSLQSKRNETLIPQFENLSINSTPET